MIKTKGDKEKLNNPMKGWQIMNVAFYNGTSA